MPISGVRFHLNVLYFANSVKLTSFATEDVIAIRESTQSLS